MASIKYFKYYVVMNKMKNASIKDKKVIGLSFISLYEK